MKKILGVISILVYLISANALVHASTMGFFDNNQTTMDNCHNTQDSSQNTKKHKDNIDCCELVYSNQYSIAQISLKNFTKNYFSFVLPKTNQLFLNKDLITYKTNTIQRPPGRNTDNKYNKFSDLAGIVVNLI